MTTFYTILFGIIIYCVCLFFVGSTSNFGNTLQQKLYLRGNTKLSSECQKLIDSLTKNKISILGSKDPKKIYLIDSIVSDLSDTHRMPKKEIKNCLGI